MKRVLILTALLISTFSLFGKVMIKGGANVANIVLTDGDESTGIDPTVGPEFVLALPLTMTYGGIQPEIDIITRGIDEAHSMFADFNLFFKLGYKEYINLLVGGFAGVSLGGDLEGGNAGAAAGLQFGASKITIDIRLKVGLAQKVIDGIDAHTAELGVLVGTYF